MNNFIYDVAFSFLSQDEDLAQRLANIVAEHYEVFIYKEKQIDLAGKDGEQEFAEVFAKQSRVVVILYREQWGQTNWTRIEESAIRSRAFDEGYDFTLFVPLDDSRNIPKWVPKNRLYFDLERFGEQSAAAVIVSKINEQFGKPRLLTPLDEARRLEEDLKFKEEERQWRMSGTGVQQVFQTLDSLYSDIETQISQILEQNPSSKFSSERGRQRDLIIWHPPISMTFDLRNMYTNNLDHLSLKVRHWDKKIVSNRNAVYIETPKTIFQEDFFPKLCRSKEIRWESTHHNKRSFNNKTLLEYCLRTFMEKVRQ